MTKHGFGLVGQAKEQLVKRFAARKGETDAARQPAAGSGPGRTAVDVPEKFYRFDQFPGYERVLLPQTAARRLGVDNPFFRTHEGIAGATTVIDGREYLNFSSYNYLGLAGHPAVNQAAKDAIDRYGTSASASRLVAGERPIQRELELALADLYEAEDCIVFVSGHATNVSTVGYLFGPKDLIVHDSLIHNSVLEGIKLSGAARRSFPHNDVQALDALLGDIRSQYERVLVVVEGVYSMDGDVPDLPSLVEIKRRHKTFLMVDEAHALGVLGASGKGSREHFGLSRGDVDIWMGTLSKTLAGCGGYIAGERALVEHLKYAAPGFVYSVGISPPLAAASLAALRTMLKEPARVSSLNKNTMHFLEAARKRDLNTGVSEGHAIVPVIVGSSLKAVKLSNDLFERGINVQPIIYPAVEEKAARLRFFLSCAHSVAQLDAAVAALNELARN